MEANARDARWAQLRRWTRDQLIDHYMAGVPQPGGNVVAGAGPRSAYRGWRKDELVTSILDLEFPGAR